MLDDMQPQLIELFEKANIPLQRKIQANLNLMYKVKMKLVQMGHYIE